MGAGDCDCQAVLLATILEAAGDPTNLCFVPRHVFVEVGIDKNIVIPRASFTRGKNYNWVPMEPVAQGADIGWLGEDIARTAQQRFPIPRFDGSIAW